MNLTKKQQQIIGEMTNEFSTFNNRQNDKGVLIDISKIQNHLIEDEMRKIESEFQNIVFKKNRMDKVIQAVTHLNKDLIQLGLCAELTDNDIIISSKTKYPQWTLNIKVKTRTKACFLSTGECVDYFDRYYCYKSNTYGTISNKDLSMITNHYYFQKKILRMYDQQQKKISLLK